MDENNNQQDPPPGKRSEGFGSVLHLSEDVSESVRKENHTLSVREVVKLFESKGVDITERSIVNYCHPNKQGVALLDCFFDNNERKYFITPDSVEKAIVEVRARKIKTNTLSSSVPNDAESSSEVFGNVPNRSETTSSKDDEKKIKELKQKVQDLDITNQVKDRFIEQMKEERNSLIETMRDDRTLIGELNTKLKQLEAPKKRPYKDGNNNSYRFVDTGKKIL